MALLLISVSAIVGSEAMAYKKDSQDMLSQRITLIMENVSLEKVLQRIESLANVKFHYSPSKLNVSQIVSIEVNNTKLSDVLRNLLPDNFEFSTVDGLLITLIEKAEGNNDNNAKSLDASTKGTITGTVVDEYTKQPLAGVVSSPEFGPFES